MKAFAHKIISKMNKGEGKSCEFERARSEKAAKMS
jgi:hypothetical protein